MVALMGKIYVALAIIQLLYSFSRKILWLKLSPTNHDPKVIARYYLELLEQLSGICIYRLIFYFCIKNKVAHCI